MGLPSALIVRSQEKFFFRIVVDLGNFMAFLLESEISGKHLK
jgi:hypothetical protein